MNPFTHHPATVGESYAEHFRVATRFGLRMVAGGLGAIVHGVFPFLCTTNGSRTVAALHAEMVRKRGAVRDAEAERQTAEYII